MKSRSSSATLKTPTSSVEILIRESVIKVADLRDSGAIDIARITNAEPTLSQQTQSHILTFLRDRGFSVVAGVDEAGRGPLAGPVVAAAVIIPEGVTVAGVNDSKKLSPEQREDVFEEIASLRLPVSVGIIDHETIDRVNILRASLMAMRRAVGGLEVKADCLLIDGNHSIPNLATAQLTIVSGDALCPSIGAASVVAKVIRDRIMCRYARLYPHFSFTEHFGYPTPQHLAELREHGPCSIHRRTFRPVAELLQPALSLNTGS